MQPGSPGVGWAPGVVGSRFGGSVLGTHSVTGLGFSLVVASPLVGSRPHPSAGPRQCGESWAPWLTGPESGKCWLGGTREGPSGCWVGMQAWWGLSVPPLTIPLFCLPCRMWRP